MDSVVILILLIIVVAVVILLMKNIENSKKMDALRNDAIEKSKQKEAEYNTRKIPTVTDGYPSLSVQPRRQTLAIDVPPLEMIPVPDDIETVGDQSLTLDEDPSQEYNEMAAVSGIREVAPPQTDENWVKSRQVEPVKDLSVGIAITNDVSKKENLQTGKISSKFPIIHKGPKMPTIDIPNAARQVAMQQAAQWVAQQGRQVEPVKDLSVGIAITNDVSKKENLQTGKISSKFPIIHKGPKMPTIDIPNAARQVAMQQAAQWVAQQERDSEIMNVIDKRARSMAESAEMEKRARIDTSGIKQYDIPKGLSPSFGLMKPAVMPNDYDKTKAVIMKDDTKKAAAEAAMEAAERAAKKVAAERATEDAQQRFFAAEAAKKAAAERATEDAQQRFFAAEAAAERAAKKAAAEKAAAKKAADEKAADEKAAAEKAAAKKAADEKAAAEKAADEKAAAEKAAIIIAFDDLGIPVTTNGRCGRLFGARCPGKQCCSGSGWCAGRQGEVSGWCSYSNRGHFVGINNGQYDGLG